MMNAIRNKAKGALKIVIWLVIASFVITIFAVWGMKGDYENNNPDVVAIVGKKNITYGELGEAWQKRLQQLYDSGVSVTEEREKELKKEILNDLIEATLLLDYAKSLNINASDEEVAQVIAGTRAFTKEGQFDKNTYLQVLYSNRISPSDFEEQQRRSLILSKLSNHLLSTVKISEEELKSYYIKRGRTLRASYAYFKASDFASKVDMDEDKLRDFYSANRNSYVKPERVKAAHILIAPDASPTSPAGYTDESAKAAAEEILKKIRAGESFAELAKKHSADPVSRGKGGELGWFGRGMMVPEFEGAAFSAKKGAVTEIVKTQFGYHIIKVEDKEEGFEPTFDKVKAKVREEYLKEESLKLAADKASAFKEMLDSGSSFEEAAKASGVSLLSTASITEKSKEHGITAENFRDALFDASLGSHTGIVGGDKGYYIFKVVSETKPAFNNASFEKEKSSLEDRLRSLKGSELSNSLTEHLKAKVKVKVLEENL